MGGADTPVIEMSLADRVRAGDNEAEEEFVQRFYKRVLLMAQVRVSDRQAAFDIAQEAMIGVLEALRQGRVKDRQHVAGYVFGTARNLINNHVRAHRRMRTEGDVFDYEDGASDPEQVASARELLEMVDRVLAQMSPDNREILRMTLVDGLKPREIADRMGLSPDVVRKRKSRANKRLRQAIRRRSRNPGSDHIESGGR